MIAASTRPRAFAVWWKDLERWDVSYFRRASWEWPAEYIQPLGSALIRKKVEVSTDDVTSIPIIAKISFGGDVSVTDPAKQKGYKGRLYWADAGDLIYSKIRMKQGSLAIVPNEIGRIAVSTEYPAYGIKEVTADRAYIALMLRTDHFLNVLEGISHGSSTKTRIHPKTFETLQVPLPPLAIQRAIVARWQEAREKVAAARWRAEKLEAEAPRFLLTELGIPFREMATLPKVFALPWCELERWSISYLARTKTGAPSADDSVYVARPLEEIAEISYGITKSPSNRPGLNARPYLRVANVQRGELELSEIKYINVTDTELENLRLQRDDLLVCEGNSADLVGRPAIWEDQIDDCVHQNHLLRVRLNPDLALPQYVLEYMHTDPARNHFRARAKFTTNLASINSSDLRELNIPLPPLDVQRALVERVREMRIEVAREREAADRLERESRDEIEALIRGTEPIRLSAHAAGDLDKQGDPFARGSG